MKIPLKGTWFSFQFSISCLVNTGSIAPWPSCSQLLVRQVVGLLLLYASAKGKLYQGQAAGEIPCAQSICVTLRVRRCWKRTVTKCCLATGACLALLSLLKASAFSSWKEAKPRAAAPSWFPPAVICGPAAAHSVCFKDSRISKSSWIKAQFLLPRLSLPTMSLHKHKRNLRLVVRSGCIFATRFSVHEAFWICWCYNKELRISIAACPDLECFFNLWLWGRSSRKLNS